MQVDGFVLGVGVTSLLWAFYTVGVDLACNAGARRDRIAKARSRAMATAGTERSDDRAGGGAQVSALPDGNHGENLGNGAPLDQTGSGR